MTNNNIQFIVLSDTDERSEAAKTVAVEIQKEFDDIGYSVKSETAHHDIERVAFDKVCAFNRTLQPFHNGEQLWHFVEFTPANEPVLILKYCMDSNENCLAELRRQNAIR